MAIVNKSTIDALTRSLTELFQDSLKETGASPLRSIVYTNPSASDREVYDDLLSFVKWREWVGERKAADMRHMTYEIKNRKFESTIVIPREKIEDDALGLYEDKVRDIPPAYERFVRKELADLLLNGDSSGATGYDGQPFFSANHKVYPEDTLTQSNISPAGTPLTGPNFDAAMEQMMLLVDHMGEPLDIMPTVLIVGPKLRAAVRNLFAVGTINGGEENPYALEAENMRIIVEPYLGTSENWYLVDARRASARPLIFQPRSPLEFESHTVGSENAFMTDNFLYGARARHGSGYGLWQTAYAGIA